MILRMKFTQEKYITQDANTTNHITDKKSTSLYQLIKFLTKTNKIKKEIANERDSTNY